MPEACQFKVCSTLDLKFQDSRLASAVIDLFNNTLHVGV